MELIVTQSTNQCMHGGLGFENLLHAGGLVSQSAAAGAQSDWAPRGLGNRECENLELAFCKPFD